MPAKKISRNKLNLKLRAISRRMTFMRAYWRATKPLPAPQFSQDNPLAARIQRVMWRAYRHTRLAPGGNVHVSVRRSHGELCLDWIETIEDGKGHGSAALDWLCGLADRYGVTLGLKIDLENRTSDPRFLQRWYERHGFVVFHKIPRSGVYMRRTPR
jgi:hypothetical protein